MCRESVRKVFQAVRRALALRCPACGYGDLYAGGLRLHDTCPYCHVRYERSPGQALAAGYTTISLSMILIFGGYWLLESLLDTHMMGTFLGFVIVVAVLMVFLYGCVRALWVAGVYLRGGVYPDPDYEREYISSRKSLTHYERP